MDKEGQQLKVKVDQQQQLQGKIKEAEALDKACRDLLDEGNILENKGQ